MSSRVKLQSATKLLREQNNQHPSPHPHHSKLGCLLLSTGNAYSSTTLFSEGREGKASYFPFEVGTIG